MYLTYEKYQTMGGTLDETTFNSICFEAQAYVDWVTFNRLQKVETMPEAVEKCMFEIIKLIQTKRLLVTPDTDNYASGGSGSAHVSGMSNDGVSVTYNVMSANELLDKDLKEVRNIIRLYLQGVTNELGQNLLYRGRYSNE